jgi:hypothetical protein
MACHRRQKDGRAQVVAARVLGHVLQVGSHADHRGLMHHCVHFGHRAPDCLTVPQIRLDAVARHAIEHDHRVARLPQPRGHLAADESRAAGHKHSHNPKSMGTPTAAPPLSQVRKDFPEVGKIIRTVAAVRWRTWWT